MKIWHRFIHPITAHFRKKRGRFLLFRFPEIRSYQICDLGGSRHFWEKLNLEIPPEQITIFNISEGDTGSISDAAENDIRIILYDGQHIPVADGAFDLLICNSVLEHVSPEQRPGLAAEMRRVAKRVFCQTPAYEFPVEPHFIAPFIHWLPRRLGFQFAKISPWRILARPSSSELHSYWWDTQLLSRREVCALFPNAVIVTERSCGMAKSYYVVEGCMNEI
jgi:hypothetical protein